MTDTENKTALEELKKELETAKESANTGDICGAVETLKNAVYNYSNFTSDWRILDYTDKIVHYTDAEQIIIEKAKNEGLYSVVWFLEEIDKSDILDIISDVLDYLTTK